MGNFEKWSCLQYQPWHVLTLPSWTILQYAKISVLKYLLVLNRMVTRRGINIWAKGDIWYGGGHNIPPYMACKAWSTK